VALLLCHCFRLAITNQRPNDDTAGAMQDSYDTYLHTNCLIAHDTKSFAALQRKIQSLGMSLQVIGRVVRDVSKDSNGFIFVEQQHRYENFKSTSVFQGFECAFQTSSVTRRKRGTLSVFAKKVLTKVSG